MRHKRQKIRNLTTTMFNSVLKNLLTTAILQSNNKAAPSPPTDPSCKQVLGHCRNFVNFLSRVVNPTRFARGKNNMHLSFCSSGRAAAVSVWSLRDEAAGAGKHSFRGVAGLSSTDP